MNDPTERLPGESNDRIPPDQPDNGDQSSGSSRDSYDSLEFGTHGTGESQPSESDESHRPAQRTTPTGDTTARTDRPGVDDSSQTVTHRVRPATSFDATVISNRTADGRVAPAPAERLSNVEIGKRLEGVQLGDYVLDEFVGGGGMGAVFRAVDLVLQRTVAVKVLTTRYGDNDEEALRFEQEAQSAARLNHENIAHVYGYGKASGWQYIVLEFIEGQNLRDVVQSLGGLSIDDTISFAWQITEALSHANAQGIVHRDIKPSNVIITPKQQAKLVDMGLAKMHHLDAGDRDLTATGVTLGTFDYISPEQGEDPSQADVRSDLYSLGCTIYFMLTAQPPFPSGTPIQKILCHKNEQPPSILNFRSDVPAGMLGIVACLLAKDPADRFQTPAALSDSLIRFADSQELPPASKLLATRVDRRAHGWIYNHVEWLAPLALLLGAVFAMDWLFQTPSLGSSSVVNSTNPQASDALPSFTNPATQTAPAEPAPVSASQVAPLKMPSTRPRRSKRTGDRPPTPPEPAADTSGVPPSAEVRSDAAVIPMNSAVQAASFARKAHTEPIESPVELVALETNVLRVVGSEQLQRHAGDHLTAQSALDAALANPEITRIEFCTTQRFQVAPLNFRGRNLELTKVGVVWPVLEFENSKDGAAISVEGGSLKSHGVHLDFRMAPGDRLFRLLSPETIELIDCFVTVTGASQTPNVLFDFSTPPLFGSLASQTSERIGAFNAAGRKSPVSAISISNCIIRGDVIVLHSIAELPCRVHWNNGLLCTSGLFAKFTGSRSANGTAQDRIDLDHVTAICDDGFLSVNAPHELNASLNRKQQMTSLDVGALQLSIVDFHCTRSILIGGSARSFLRGSAASLHAFEPTFFFAGQRNFYENIHRFWPSSADSGVEESDRTAWQERWSASESLAQFNEVMWQNEAWLSIGRTQATPAHFRLDPSSSNPARQASGGLDRSDGGFRWHELPGHEFVAVSGWVR